MQSYVVVAAEDNTGCTARVCSEEVDREVCVEESLSEDDHTVISRIPMDGI